MKLKPNLTIDDIARVLGVSKTTVSRAISGKGRISQATRDRVLAYIQRTNYRPNVAAKALAENKTYNLALVLPKTFISLDLPFIRKSMSAICEEAFSRNYHILICLCADDDPSHLVHILDHRKADGVILARTVENDHLAELLIKRKVPFATLGTLPLETHGKAQVEADHDQIGGCRAFTANFLAGHSGKIAVLGNDLSYMVNQSRLTGIQQALTDRGLPNDHIHVRMGICDDAACAQAMDELLGQTHHRFLAMDDEVCLRILGYLEKRYSEIPSHIQVASLDSSEALRSGYPAIPTLCFDAAELGRTACRELLRYLHKEDYDPAPLLGYKF